MVFALILDSKVVQISAVQTPVSVSLQWIDITGITPAPEVGWSFDGRDFTPPPAPPPTRPRSVDPLSAEEIATELVRKGLVTRAEFDTIKTSR